MDEAYKAINDVLVNLINEIWELEEKAIITEEFKDLTNNDMHVIEAIGLGEGRNMSSIAKKLNITVGTLTTAVNSLVNKKYAVRRRSEEDRRVVFVSLTEKCERADRHHEDYHRHMTWAIPVSYTHLDVYKRQSQMAFGDNTMYIEHFVQHPRHIEFQILADSYGNVIHLGERDCSIERNHQKMIEEAPSIALSDELRQRMGEAAVRAAKAAGYENAGTIEFLLEKNGNFYFMEMNTRIQVEHPVTEWVTGIDLVKEQIRIASGKKLSYTQDQVHLSGHAIECRINAENPAKGFRPSPGTIQDMYLPGGKGIRIDSAIDVYKRQVASLATGREPPWCEGMRESSTCLRPTRTEPGERPLPARAAARPTA